MRSIFFALLFSVPALAGTERILDGTCTTRATSGGWCRCDVINEYDQKDRRFFACGLLKCEQYRAGEAPADCRSLPTPEYATCTLSNPRYGSGGQYCFESERVLPGASRYDTCSGVLQCLNDDSCGRNYCRSTHVRGGWSLIGVE